MNKTEMIANVAELSGLSKKDAEKAVNLSLIHILQQRTPLVAKAGGENAPVSVVQGDNAQAYTAQVVVPIISEGESTGAVVVLSREKDVQLSEAERKSAQVAAGFLGRQMEG